MAGYERILESKRDPKQLVPSRIFVATINNSDPFSENILIFTKYHFAIYAQLKRCSLPLETNISCCIEKLKYSISVDIEQSSIWRTLTNRTKKTKKTLFGGIEFHFYQKVESMIVISIITEDTEWSRKVKTVFLNFKLLCKNDLKRKLRFLFEKNSLIVKHQNAA